jgi:serine phosphatase RsbU (regulator of sigma subunit)
VAKSEEINRQNQSLAAKNQHITDSINYASRIQRAILGNPSAITAHFKDAFVLLKPRDIVSGDFYWHADMPGGGELIIAADCTGHGVPGAFMTVMGNALLNDIVSERNIYEPAQILHELDKKVLASTGRQHEGEDASINDGMDMAIIHVDKQKGQLVFAGAKNPLYRVRNGEIETFSGAKFPIGSAQFRSEKVFESIALDLQAGDRFYLSTDGYQDQFGGEKNSKFMRKRFRELLLRISLLPMQEQKRVLEEELALWMGEQSQTDDILVIGITI